MLYLSPLSLHHSPSPSPSTLPLAPSHPPSLHSSLSLKAAGRYPKRNTTVPRADTVGGDTRPSAPPAACSQTSFLRRILRVRRRALWGGGGGEEREKGSERASERASEREREPDFVRGWEGDKRVYVYSERPLTETRPLTSRDPRLRISALFLKIQSARTLMTHT